MYLPRRPVVAVAVLAVLAVPGCGGSADSGPVAPPSVSTLTPDGSAAPSESGSPSAPSTVGGAVEITVDIEDGEVTPSGERVDVMVGQTIRLIVDSDADEEIHVHSAPEHSFTIKAGADDREFEFTLQQPGVVAAELHELGDVVATFAVRP